MDFLWICEDRLNPRYFSLHSGTVSIVLESGEQTSCNCQWPKSLVCRGEDSGEQGSKRPPGKRRSQHTVLVQSFTLIVDPAQGLRDEAPEQSKQEYRQSISSAVGFQQNKVIWKLKNKTKTRIPKAVSRNVQFKTTQTWILLSKGFILQKNISHNECVKSIQWGLFPVC